jgi:RNA polymerase sigma-70 factor, ECF subfamily
VTNLAMTDVGASPATVRQAAAGDEVAFARLVAEHHASMARVAFAITGDAETAADAVQVAWATAWRRLGSLRDPLTIRAWLVAIAANEARQVLRRQRRRTLVNFEAIGDLPADGEPGDRISAVDLARVLRGLDPDDRSLLALRFAARLDSSEIAAQLGMTASGVRSRLSRLLEHVRTELDHG